MAAPAPTWILGKIRSCCTSGVGLPGTWVWWLGSAHKGCEAGRLTQNLVTEGADAAPALGASAGSVHQRQRALPVQPVVYTEQRTEAYRLRSLLKGQKQHQNNLAMLGSQAQKSEFFLRMIGAGRLPPSPWLSSLGSGAMITVEMRAGQHTAITDFSPAFLLLTWTQDTSRQNKTKILPIVQILKSCKAPEICAAYMSLE